MILVVNPNPAVDRVAVVDFRPRATLRPRRFSLWAGGSGVHAAYVARLLGADVLVLGFAGGSSGDRFRQLLERQGLPAELVDIQGETRGTYSLLDAETGDICNIPEPGPPVTRAEDDQLERAVRSRLADADLVIVSGSVPPGCSPDVPARIVAAARARGIPCIADLAGDVLLRALPARPWLIKPSLDELTELGAPAGGDLAAQVVLARSWVAAGVANVCLSRGADGLLWVAAGAVRRIAPPTVPPFNPIGCGDTLIGATAAHYVASGDLTAALRVGVAAAAANVAYDAPGYCTPDDVARLLPQTRVEPISGIPLVNATSVPSPGRTS